MSATGFFSALLLLGLGSGPTESLEVSRRAAVPDTFEVYYQARGPGILGPSRVVADELDAVGYGMISLKSDGEIVAIFQTHQVVAVLNRTVSGERSFRIQLQQGQIDFSADRIIPSQSNMILLFSGGAVKGVVNTGQMQSIMDLQSVVGAGWPGAGEEAPGRPVS